MMGRDRALGGGARRAHTPMNTSLAGKTLGNLRICGRLGSGGVGQVWRAVDTTLGRTVAVKALRPEFAGNSDVAKRFRSEAQTLARLNHPNIATLHDLLEVDDALYMVLEFVEGQTFAELLRIRGRLDLVQAFDLLHPVLDGLAYAHQAGVVHRDIKPSNLMVDARGLVKVMDFGIARFSGDERVTRTGHLIGTPEYMSPEQIRGEAVSVQSDLYALGLLLFTLLTGRPPFQRAAEFDVLKAQVESTPPPLRSLAPDAPAAMEAVIDRALAKDPGARFASIDAFRDALLTAGAPDRTAGDLATWTGATLPGVSASDSHAIDPEAPTVSNPAVTSPAAVRGNVGRWQHAAVALLALGLSAGANWLHVQPAASDAGSSVTAVVADEVAVIAAPIEATPPPSAPEPSKAVAPTRARRDAPRRPPKAEETGWLIRR